jgi:c-di-GMP-binding flagellar brake protein YcgR
MSISERFTVKAGEKTWSLEARDISLGGIFLYGDDEALSVSTQLQVEVAMGGGAPPLVLPGEVVRVLPVPNEPAKTLGVGVRWLDLDEDQRGQLARAVDRLLRAKAGRREHPRLAAFLSVACVSHRQAEMVLENLSAGGMALLVDSEVEVGNAVEIELQVFGQEPLRLSGEVRRSDRTEELKTFRRIGVQFGPLSAETRSALQQVLMRLIR